MPPLAALDLDTGIAQQSVSRVAPAFDPGQFFARRKVLVTGGLGFIGSNLARRLVELGAEVSVVDALMPNSGANRANLADIAGRLHTHIANLGDPEAIAALVRDQEAIFNMAGNVSHIDSMNEPLVDLEANVRAQIVFLEACRHQAPSARIVYASTRQIYGRPAYLPVDERHPLNPVDVNGINKMAGEAYHMLYERVYGLGAVSLRLTNVFGPRMRVKDARQTFLGIWLRRVVEDGVFEVWGGEQKRDLTYVDDAVQALLAAARPTLLPGQVFNVGGSSPVSLHDLAALLVRVAGRGRFEVKPFPADRARIDIGDFCAVDARFRAATAWQPVVALADGLSRSVDYYRSCLHAYI